MFLLFFHVDSSIEKEIGALQLEVCEELPSYPHLRFLSLLLTKIMLDTIDDALDDDEAEDETEELTNQAASLIAFINCSL